MEIGVINGKFKKGQALVETALVLPIILLILMGIIDFGLMFNNYLVLNNASRDCARNVIVGKSDSDAKAIVAELTSQLDQTKITVNITPGDGMRIKGDEVNITIEYDNSLLTPIIREIVPNPVKLKVKTVMRME